MSRKWIGVVVAVVLAALGTYVLVNYVQSAEERALEGQETIEVFVVTEPVAAGSPASELTNKVTTELVPAKVQATGSVANLNELTGQVAAVDLVVGEQVVATRFVTPADYEEIGEVEIPEGLVELTVSLSPDRAVGGALRPGDLVAVFASFEPFDLNGAEPEADPEVIVSSDDPAEVETLLNNVLDAQPTKTPNTTHLIIHKVLVTNVQLEQAPAPPATTTDGDTTQTPDYELAPTGNLLVTLAMEPPNAERVVFTAEFGTVWLGEESEKADEEGTTIQNRNKIYDDLEAKASR